MRAFRVLRESILSGNEQIFDRILDLSLLREQRAGVRIVPRIFKHPLCIDLQC